MAFFRRARLEEQMSAAIEDEFERRASYCRELHEDFERGLRVRNESRTTLAAAEEEFKTIQGQGVTLLGEINAAMQKGDGERLKELEGDYRRSSRELDRARRRRDAAARTLAEADFDEAEAARELSQVAKEMLDEYASRSRELKELLTRLLDEHQKELERAVAPLIEEHQSRQRSDTPDEG